MIKTLKTRVYPKTEDMSYFREAFGIRRFLWNWAIRKNNRRLDKNWLLITPYTLSKQMNAIIKRFPDKYGWIKNVNSMVMQEVFNDMHDAYKKMFSKHTARPKFRSRKDQTDSFRVHLKGPKAITIDGKHKLSIVGTRKYGRINLKTMEDISFIKNYRICNVDIKEEYNGVFYMYLKYEIVNHNRTFTEQKSIGIDTGVKTPIVAIDNTGRIFQTNVPISRKKQEKKTERINKQLSKKEYMSNNYIKCNTRLAKSYKREFNIMDDVRKKAIHYIVNNYSKVNVESIENKNFKYREQNRARLRFGIGYYVSHLIRKCVEYGIEVNLIENKPTTQMCSICGNILDGDDKLTLDDRVYTCDICNHVEDRDVNAARNILNII